MRRFSFETLYWDRVADMRKLRQLRGSIDEGGREMFVLAACRTSDVSPLFSAIALFSSKL